MESTTVVSAGAYSCVRGPQTVSRNGQDDSLILARGPDDLDRDRGHRGRCGQDEPRHGLPEVPASAEEQRHDAYSRHTARREPTHGLGHVRAQELQIGEFHRTFRRAAPDELRHAFERLGPARIARTVREQKDSGFLHGVPADI